MRIAASRMDKYAGLLVKNDKLRILVNDIEGNIFRQDVFARRLRQDEADAVAGI